MILTEAEQKEKNARYMQVWVAAHPGYKTEQSRKVCEKRNALRQAVLDKLGNECKHCGFTDKRALQIDHIHGRGQDEYGRKGYTYLYYVSILNNPQAETKYQILCANCNWIKRHENNELNKGVAHKKRLYT